MVGGVASRKRHEVAAALDLDDHAAAPRTTRG